MPTDDTEHFETTVSLSRLRGIHAGPSQQIFAFVRGTGCKVQLVYREQTIDAISVLSLLELQKVSQGDQITIIAHGPNAQRVVMALARFLTGMDEEIEAL